jgi:hypothetical protein
LLEYIALVRDKQGSAVYSLLSIVYELQKKKLFSLKSPSDFEERKTEKEKKKKRNNGKLMRSRAL